MQPPLNSLRGKVAVITGAASGIGAATAVHLAELGADVILHTRRNQAGLQATAEKVQSHGSHTLCLLADLRDPAEQDRLINEAWRWKDHVDIWVNNAGADVLTGEAAGWSFERKLEEIWLVDVTSTIRLSRAIGLRMRELKDDMDRTIINIGWDQAAQGMAGDSGEMFAASKGAIMAFSKSLAQSLAPHVRVNCVAPGWVQTAWGEQASEAWQARASRESLQARWGNPNDIAAAITFLASPAATFINGQVLPVNGGFRYGSQAAE